MTRAGWRKEGMELTGWLRGSGMQGRRIRAGSLPGVRRNAPIKAVERRACNDRWDSGGRKGRRLGR